MFIPRTASNWHSSRTIALPRFLQSRSSTLPRIGLLVELPVGNLHCFSSRGGGGTNWRGVKSKGKWVCYGCWLYDCHGPLPAWVGFVLGNGVDGTDLVYLNRFFFFQYSLLSYSSGTRAPPFSPPRPTPVYHFIRIVYLKLAILG